MLNLNKKAFSHFDYMILLTSAPIVLMSIILIYEIERVSTTKQLLYIAFTLIVSAIIFLLPLRRMLWVIPAFYWASIALVLSVEIIGIDKGGAKRWLEIPFIGMSLQPSEMVKVGLFLMLAYNIHNNPPPEDGYGLRDFLKHSFFILLPVILVKIQPDLGTSILIFICGYSILFLVGVHKKILLAGICILILSSPIIYVTLKDYQLQRIESLINPTAQSANTHQVNQSIIAIGSGGLLGKDSENATQYQLRFLPVPESDFIFAYFCERYGFVGGMALLFCYSLLILQLFSLSHQYRKDKILQVLCAGVGFLIFIHISVNMLMVMKLAPVVGIPLPFFSYGGSSFLTFGILFAILQNLIAFKYNFKI
ncbi:FtsW/RodA/SpoVE family cell cycle protein [Helicobacter sp. 23-1045]